MKIGSIRGCTSTLAVLLLLLRVTATSAEAAPILLTNADFESGSLSGWSTFTTVNGTLGTSPLPTVSSFDVDGDSVATNSAQFQVGQITFQSGVQAGGGIYQTFTSGAGSLTLSADIASLGNNPSGSNVAGGFFSLLLDGAVVDTFDFGSIVGTTIERATLNAVIDVTAGSHEIRILMTRPFLALGTPYQFIDDVSLDLASTSTPAPEPASMLLLGTGLLGAGLRRWRQNRA